MAILIDGEMMQVEEQPQIEEHEDTNPVILPADPRLPLQIDASILSDLNELEQDIIIGMANSTYDGVPYAIFCDVEQETYSLGNLVSVFHAAYERHRPEILEGIPLERIHGHRAFHNDAGNVLQNLMLKNLFVFGEIQPGVFDQIPLEEDEDPMGAFFIHPKYVMRPDEKKLAPYIEQMLHTIYDDFAAGNEEDFVDISGMGCACIGGASTLLIRLLEKVEEAGERGVFANTLRKFAHRKWHDRMEVFILDNYLHNSVKKTDGYYELRKMLEDGRKHFPEDYQKWVDGLKQGGDFARMVRAASESDFRNPRDYHDPGFQRFKKLFED